MLIAFVCTWLMDAVCLSNKAGCIVKACLERLIKVANTVLNACYNNIVITLCLITLQAPAFYIGKPLTTAVSEKLVAIIISYS